MRAVVTRVRHEGSFKIEKITHVLQKPCSKQGFCFSTHHSATTSFLTEQHCLKTEVRRWDSRSLRIVQGNWFAELAFIWARFWAGFFESQG